MKGERQSVLRALRDRLGGDGDGVVAAVIDSGWDRAQPSQGVSPGVAVRTAAGVGVRVVTDDRDRIGHGTLCINRIRLIAPAAEILPIRVFGRRLETSIPALLAALDCALERNVDVVNLSLGTVVADAKLPLYARCEQARKRGVIIVAASSRGRGWSFPAVFDNVVGVEGVDGWPQFRIAYRPGSALEFATSSLCSPAVGLGGRAMTVIGPSYAAPTIAGLAALIKARRRSASLVSVRRSLAELARSGGPVTSGLFRAQRRDGIHGDRPAGRHQGRNRGNDR